MARFLVALAMVVAVLAFVAVGEVQATATVGYCDGTATIGGVFADLALNLGNGNVNPMTGGINRPATGKLRVNTGPLDEYGVNGQVDFDDVSGVSEIHAQGYDPAPIATPFYTIIVRAQGNGDPFVSPITITGQALLVPLIGGATPAPFMGTLTCQFTMDP